MSPGDYVLSSSLAYDIMAPLGILVSCPGFGILLFRSVNSFVLGKGKSQHCEFIAVSDISGTSC